MNYDTKTPIQPNTHSDFHGIGEAIQESSVRPKAKFSQRDFADALEADIIAAVHIADAKKPRLTGAQIGEIFKSNYHGTETLTDEFVRRVCWIVTAYRSSKKIKRLRKSGGGNSTAARQSAPSLVKLQNTRAQDGTNSPASKQAPSPYDIQPATLSAIGGYSSSSQSIGDHETSIVKLVTFDEEGVPTAKMLGRWKRDDEPIANSFFQAIYYQKPYRNALSDLVQDHVAIAKITNEGGERAQILEEIRVYFHEQKQ